MPAFKPAKVKRVLFCSGKLYYDLLEFQENNQREDVAIVRLEQIYPLPQKSIQAIAKKYKNAKKLIWVQEEPENAGAYEFLLRKVKFLSLEFIFRPEIGSPATGFNKQHKAEQQQLIEKAFE